MDSNNNKYALPAGFAGSLSLSLLFFFNHSSYATKHIISIIFFVIITIMLIFSIAWRKHLKPWIFSGVICLFLLSLTEVLYGYFISKNMKAQNFTILLMTVMAIIFGYVATKQQTSILKDKKKIDTMNKKFIVAAFIFAVMGIIIAYGAFIKNK